jgi:hypothetical protein
MTTMDMLRDRLFEKLEDLAWIIHEGEEEKRE